MFGVFVYLIIWKLLESCRNSLLNCNFVFASMYMTYIYVYYSKNGIPLQQCLKLWVVVRGSHYNYSGSFGMGFRPIYNGFFT